MGNFYKQCTIFQALFAMQYGSHKHPGLTGAKHPRGYGRIGQVHRCIVGLALKAP
jgi:hypothetical protein